MSNVRSIGRVLLVFSLLAAGLVLGVAFEGLSQSDCPVVSLWGRAKATLGTTGKCDRDAMSEFLKSSADCESPRVRVALPAVRVIGASLLAKNALATPADDAGALWAYAGKACVLAGGRDCSRTELERMVPIAKEDHAER
jgi:hypothetical protein